MATEIVTDTALHQFHRTLVLNNKPSWSNTNQKTSLVLKTRDQTQYVYTIQTNPISQTNHLEHTVTQKTKHYTMDSHYYRQRQTWLLIWQTNRNTYATISNSFSPTYVIYDIPSPTFLTKKVLIVSKKKNNTRKRESEGDGRTNMRPQPLGVNQESTTTEKKRGRKGRNLAIEDRGRKTSSVPSEPPSEQGHNEFFSLSQNFFSTTSFLKHDWRQFNFGISTHDENDIRHRSTSLG